jgi:hypothetical protein
MASGGDYPGLYSVPVYRVSTIGVSLHLKDRSSAYHKTLSNGDQGSRAQAIGQRKAVYVIPFPTAFNACVPNE